MADRKKKSKKRSRSKKPKQPPKGFTLYLCANIDYDDVANKLDKAGIRFKRHRDHFKGSTPDTVLLKEVGRKGWILITADKKQRTRLLERKAIEQYKVREFVLTSGDIGDVGDLLVKASRQIRQVCKKHPGPFVASISKSGNGNLKDAGGPTQSPRSTPPDTP
jgi:hypothetical protein